MLIVIIRVKSNLLIVLFEQVDDLAVIIWQATKNQLKIDSAENYSDAHNS